MSCTLIKTVLALPSLSPRACLAFLHEQLAGRLALVSRAVSATSKTRCVGVAMWSSVWTCTALGEQLATFVDPLGKQPTILPEYPLREQVLAPVCAEYAWRLGLWAVAPGDRDL